MSIDPTYAAWLAADARFATAEAATIWSGQAVTTEAISSLATPAGSSAEAERQRSFQAGPIVRDKHVVAGLRHDLLGKLIRLTIGRLGYDAGVKGLVIAVREVDGAEQTELLVLLRLA